MGDFGTDFLEISEFCSDNFINPRRHKVKKLHEGIRGDQSNPSPLLFTPSIQITKYLAHIMSVLCTFN